MASALAQQLQLVQQLQGAVPGAKKTKGKPSLLFDNQKAADLDAETIYEIGCQGLSELCRLNSRFSTLREALFSRAAASIVRDQQQPEALAQLDAAIEEFCGLLTQHFLAPGAFKALEYLIRKFKANEYNTHSLIMAGLPYHATNEFVVLVQTLHLDAKRGLWGWLAPVQTSGASVPREVLVQRCMNDPQLMTWLCETARKLGSDPVSVSCKAYLSFYAVTLCEIINSMQVVDDGQLSQLLPWVSTGLESGMSVEYRSATLMIVAALCSKATLSKSMAKAVINSLLRNHTPKPDQDRTLLMVLAHVAGTQPQLAALPEKALKALLGLPALAEELNVLQKARARVAPLQQLLASSLVTRLASKPQEYGSHLDQLIRQGCFSLVAERLALDLLQQACQEGTPAEVVEVTQGLLKALDTHHPEQTDKSVNTLLGEYNKQSKVSKVQGDSSDDEEQEQAGDEALRNRVFALVQSLFSHSVRAPCGNTSMTLAAAVQAPAAGVRKMALQKMDELLRDQEVSADAHSHMTSCLLNGLQDSDLDVVSAVLDLPSLPTLPLSALLAALSPALLRSSALLYSPSTDSASARQARSVLLRVIKVLGKLSVQVKSGQGSDSAPVRQELHSLCVLAALQAALPARHALKVTQAALDMAATLDSPLFAQVSDLKSLSTAMDADGDGEAGKKSKGKGGASGDKWAAKAAKAEARELAAQKLEQKLVQVLAHAVSLDPTKLGQELVQLSQQAQSLQGTAPAFSDALLRARHLLVLVLHAGLVQAAKSTRKGQAQEVAPQLLALTLQELSSSKFTGNDALGQAWTGLVEECVDASGSPTAQHAAQFHEFAPKCHQALLCHCLLAALEGLPKGGVAAADSSASSAHDLAAVFGQVAALKPNGSFDAHLKLLVQQALPQPQQQAAFLASVYTAGEVVQGQAALRLAGAMTSALGHAQHSATPIKGGSKASSGGAGTTADAVQAVLAHVPHMLAAAGSTAGSELRSAAVSALLAVGSACGGLPQATFPSSGAVGTCLAALEPHKSWIAGDATAITTLISNTLINTVADKTSEAGDAATTPAKGRKSKKDSAGDTAGSGTASSRLAVGPTECQALLQLFAHVLTTCPGAPHDIAAVHAVLQGILPLMTSGAPPATSMVPACLQLLASILSSSTTSASDAAHQVGAMLIRAVFNLSIISPTAAAIKASEQDPHQLFMKALSCRAAASEPNQTPYISPAPIRLAALQCLASGTIPPLLSSSTAHKASQQPDHLAAIVQALAVSASGDSSQECVDAARAALEALPISAHHITPVLLAARAMPTAASRAASEAPSTTSTRKKRKGAQGAVEQGDDSATAGTTTTILLPPPGALEQAVLLLEMLQWKSVTEEEEVVAASQQLLTSLQPAMAPIVTAHAGSADAAGAGQEEDEEEGGAAAEPGVDAATTGRSSLAGYAAQLILTCLDGTAKRLAAGQDTSAPHQAKAGRGTSKKASQDVLSAFDCELAVSVAQNAPDALVRNAALSLLSHLAVVSPEKVLKHVLQVLAIVNTSTATTDDHYSQQVATTALSAVVPAWLAAGHDLAELWASLVACLPTLPAHRRLPLLTTMLNAAQDDPACLSTGLLLLLKSVVQLQEQRLAAKRKETAVSKVEEGDDGEWMLQLAAQLASKAPLEARVESFSSLLKQSVAAAGNAAHAPLPRLAVTFVAGQLKVKSVMSAALDHQHDEGLLTPCETLMNQALACVQLLVNTNTTQPAGSPAGKSAKKGKPDQASPAAADKKVERAVRSSIKGLYTLFEALRGVMAPHSYLQALLRLSKQPGDKLKRRALRLFADRAADLGQDLGRISQHPAYNSKAKAAAVQRLATASLAIFPVVTDLAAGMGATGQDSKASPLTHQAALSALGHVVAAFGPSHAAEVCQVLPAVIKHIKHVSSAVRGSALASIAAAINACSTQLLPQLPAAAQAVVSTSEEAARSLAAASPAGGAAFAPATTPGKRSKASGGDADGEEQGEEEEATAVELAAVELAAGLAAIGCLVSSLGPFLSPYLPAILRVLLHPAVLNCQVAGCAQAAAAVRKSLVVAVPARLLLDPLFNALPYAMDQGLAPLEALLGSVTRVAEGMEAAVAASQSELIFSFLLKALDVRSNPTPALQGHEHQAESAAVSALVALTLKLSEVKFKPLFLRLLEWACLPVASGPSAGSANLGRITTLFAAAVSLADKLRSVFVPYYRHLLDLAVKHLTAATDVAVGPASAGKKKRKADAEPVAVEQLGPAAKEQLIIAKWVLRGMIQKALYRCFLYDSIGWTDGDKVERLLPALVTQIQQEPSPAASAVVAVQCADVDMAASVKFGSRTPTDTAGIAAVAVLVQLAQAANSDVHWKPLNHKVLMVTRTGSVRARCLALEVVSHLVDRLREEYLVLLPGTLPFLSELLEDPDVAVEARAQHVLKSLEDVSGEKLDQYLKT